MATKDPQWIVSNREDGTNVNAWHWVEHDCLPFLQQHAEELFCGQGFGGDGGRPRVTVKGAADAGARVTGEATANNRRQKTIYIYELEVVLKCDAAPAVVHATRTSQSSGSVSSPTYGNVTVTLCAAPSGIAASHLSTTSSS